MTRIPVQQIDREIRIQNITWAKLPYLRPRCAGKNARLDTHGWGGDVPIARIQAGGTSGFGWSRIAPEQARRLVGLPVHALFDESGMLKSEFRSLEFPLLDWLGNHLNLPVFRLLAANDQIAAQNTFAAPVYDTSIYFDELDVQDDKEAIALITSEVAQGLAQNHKHFKVKIGRCGMWMDIDRGMRRDIGIIHAIRALIGPEGKLMVDANNGYNLNLTKAFLSATKEDKLHWLEEAFHEDDMLYANLKQWMARENIDTMIADGEGYACIAIEDWARKGLVQVLQYDLRDYGLFRWLELAAKLEPFGVLCAPHNYGGFYGNYAQAHFAAALNTFAFAEFDDAQCEGIDTSGFSIREGMLHTPSTPGFGLKLDGNVMDSFSGQNGWTMKALGQ